MFQIHTGFNTYRENVEDIDITNKQNEFFWMKLYIKHRQKKYTQAYNSEMGPKRIYY